MADNPEMLALMKRFRIAYAKADKETLLAVTTEDFVWHNHFALNREQQPAGRKLAGIDGLLKEVAWRRQNWTEVRYDNMVERATSDMLVQTFTISGYEDGERFLANVVDLYPVRDGLISGKDTYWKYLK